jgi:hypothetical protein
MDNVSSLAQKDSMLMMSPKHANLVTQVARPVMDQTQITVNLVTLHFTIKTDIAYLYANQELILVIAADVANHVPMNAKNVQEDLTENVPHVKMDTT